MQTAIIDRESHFTTVVVIALPMLLVTGALASMHGKDIELTPFDETLESRGFELIAEKKGVSVYRSKKSKYIRLAAEGRLAAPPDKVRKALLAYEEQPGVIKRVAESRILSTSKNRMLVYQRLDLPVISDRDYTLWVKWGKSGDVRWVRYWLAKNEGPEEREDAVRVPHHQGSWQLKPIDGGKATLLRYQVSIDLGGKVPMGLAKSGAGKEVPGVYRDVCRVLGSLGKKPQPCLLQAG